MIIKRMRNLIKITDIIDVHGQNKAYGFGIVLDGSETPNFVFIPPRMVAIYELTKDDVGEIFDCIFRDDGRREDGKQDPVVIAIMEDDDPINETVVVSEYDTENPDITNPTSDDIGLPEFITANQTEEEPT